MQVQPTHVVIVHNRVSEPPRFCDMDAKGGYGEDHTFRHFLVT